MKTYRIGQIVPSSNVTMETEIPALLRAREAVSPERFTFHSSRMRMKKVTAEELAAMDRDSDRCALELSDAAVDVMGYACLVAIMSMGRGYHRESQKRLGQHRLRPGGAHRARQDIGRDHKAQADHADDEPSQGQIAVPHPCLKGAPLLAGKVHNLVSKDPDSGLKIPVNSPQRQINLTRGCRGKDQIACLRFGRTCEAKGNGDHHRQEK